MSGALACCVFGLAIFGQSPTAPLAGRVQELVGKDLAGARVELNAALKRAPDDAALFNLLGVVEAQAQNYRAAESAFQKSIRLAPRAGPVYENLGRLYQEHASEDRRAAAKALETYKALLRIEPGNGEGLFQAARLLAFEGAYAQSRSYLQKLPPETLAQPGSLAVLTVDGAGAGVPEKARDAAERLLKHPDLAEADVTSILPALERTSDRKIAATLLEGLAARGLASPPSLGRLAAFYENAGRLPKARETLEAAARTGGVNVPSLLALARVAFKQRDFEGTLGYLGHARDMDPRNAGIHFFFGIDSIELNLPLEAEKSLAEAVSLDPSNPYYHYALGAVKLQLEKHEEAIPHFREYAKAKPEDARGTLALGVAYFQAQQNEPAADQFRRAAGHPETAAAAHYYLGRTEMRRGETEQAIGEFEKTLAADPKYADAYAELASAHLDEKQYPETEKDLARALAIEPDHYRANLYLLTLYRRLRDPRKDAQEARVNKLREKQFESLKFLMRTVDVRPY